MNHIKIYTIILGLLFSCYLSHGQKDRKSYLIPSAAAFSLGKNEVEVNLFSSMGYNFRAFNFASAPYGYLEGEFHSINSMAQVTYGLTTNQNFNIGVDFNQVSTFEAGNFDNSSSFYRLGPRIRWRPLGALGSRFDLSLQNSALFTVSDENGFFTSDPEFRNQLILSQFIRLDALKIDIILQATGEFNINPRLAGWEESRKRPYTIPASLLFGIAPNENFIIFGSFSYNTEQGNIPWVDNQTYYLRRSAMAATGGVQITFARKHSLFLAHSFLLDEIRGGGANAASIGLRLLFIEKYDDPEG